MSKNFLILLHFHLVVLLGSAAWAQRSDFPTADTQVDISIDREISECVAILQRAARSMGPGSIDWSGLAHKISTGGSQNEDCRDPLISLFEEAERIVLGNACVPFESSNYRLYPCGKPFFRFENRANGTYRLSWTHLKTNYFDGGYVFVETPLEVLNNEEL